MGSLCNLSSSQRNPHFFPSSSIIGKTESHNGFVPKHSRTFDSIETTPLCVTNAPSTSSQSNNCLTTCSSDSCVLNIHGDSPSETSNTINCTASSPNVSTPFSADSKNSNSRNLSSTQLLLHEEAWDTPNESTSTGCICGCTCTQCVFRRHYIWNKNLLPEQMLSNEEYWDAQWFASKEDSERDQLELRTERAHPTCRCTCFQSQSQSESESVATSLAGDRWVDINPYTKRPFENPHGKPRRYYPYSVRYHVEQFVSKRVWWPEDAVERYRWYFCWSAPDPSHLREPWDVRAIRRFLKPLPPPPQSPKPHEYDEFDTAPFEVLFPGLERLSPSYITPHTRLQPAAGAALPSPPLRSPQVPLSAARKRLHPGPSELCSAAQVAHK